MTRFVSFIFLYCLLIKTISFKILNSNTKTNLYKYHKLYVSNLAPEVSNDLLTLQDFMTTSPSSPNYNDVQTIAILLAATSYFVFENRPRGSANQDLVEVKRSTIKTGQTNICICWYF